MQKISFRKVYSIIIFLMIWVYFSLNAKYLDKEKFEVHTMYTSKKSVDKEYYKKLDIKLHRLIHHRFIWYWSKWLTMLFGNYDIYYLGMLF